MSNSVYKNSYLITRISLLILFFCFVSCKKEIPEPTFKTQIGDGSGGGSGGGGGGGGTSNGKNIKPLLP